MTFQVGNQYGTARRLVEGELRKVVHRNPDRLRSALERVVLDAAEAEAPAHRLACLSFIADRLDGRPKQAVDITTSADARELDLASVVQAVLAARAHGAQDATLLEHSDNANDVHVLHENHSAPGAADPVPAPDPAP